MGRDFGRAGPPGTRAAVLRADDAGAARPWLSVVVVTRGPSLVLARLLRSIGRVNTPAEAEVLIGLNGSNRVEETRRLVHRYVGSTRARVESLACAPPAVVRNKLAENAAAPFLLFVDDDVELPPEFLEEVQVIAREGRVAVAGGPNLTPPASNEFEQLTGRVLGSMFATGPLRHRYRREPARVADERTLGLSNLVVERRAFAPAQFDARLTGANENEFLIRLGQANGRVVYRPRLAVYHHRRPTLRSYFKQIVKYGFGRGQLIFRARSRRQLPFLLPTVALLGVLALAIVRPLFAVVAVAAYALVVAAAALHLAGLRRAATAGAIIAATHTAYALGVLIGLLAAAVQPLAPTAAERSGIWRW